MTTPERLGLLLPWINEEPLTDDQVRRQLLRFLKGFRSAPLRVNDYVASWSAHDAPADELRPLRLKLTRVFESAVPRPQWRGAAGKEGITDDDMATPLLNLPSLRFDVHRGADGVSLCVGAKRMQDLVPFLVMNLLTTVTVARCSAPAPMAWDRWCDHLFVGPSRGRPKKFCSSECKDRHTKKRIFEAERKQRQGKRK